MKRKTTKTKIGLYRNKQTALNAAKKARKRADNDIDPFNTKFYSIEKTKKPKNPKKPGYYVVRTSKKKTPSQSKKARNNLR
jgi:hypothetical protein